MDEALPRCASYYSMIARLVLAETEYVYNPTILDINLMQLQFDQKYVRLNLKHDGADSGDRPKTSTDSRSILSLAVSGKLDSNAQRWLDLLYGFPVEVLTMSRLLARNPVVRFIFPQITQSKPSPTEAARRFASRSR